MILMTALEFTCSRDAKKLHISKYPKYKVPRLYIWVQILKISGGGGLYIWGLHIWSKNHVFLEGKIKASDIK